MDLRRLYFERLEQMVGATRENRRAIRRKAIALEWAIGLATAETLLLLVALWLASSSAPTGSAPASHPSRGACTWSGEIAVDPGMPEPELASTPVPMAWDRQA